MGDQEKKDKQGAPGARWEGDRAAGLLQGLSTVPVLGLFGYAVKKQRIMRTRGWRRDGKDAAASGQSESR